MSVNVILLQGNQKNIRVGLSGRNNADSGLFNKKKRNFSSRTDVFLKSQLFSKSTLNLARFDRTPSTANLSRFEKFRFWPNGREVWEVRFKKLSLYPALSLCVAEAPAGHEFLWM